MLQYVALRHQTTSCTLQLFLAEDFCAMFLLCYDLAARSNIRTSLLAMPFLFVPESVCEGFFVKKHLQNTS